MTKEEIIELARKSDLHCHLSLKQEHGLVIEDLMYFASLVAAKERERCAMVCETLGDEYACGDWPTPKMCAEAIRSLK